MDDSISRQQAIDAMCALVDVCVCDDEWRENPHIDAIIDTLENLPSAQKQGRWINKNVHSGDDIEEWQECQCSECKRWDTRPYMYYFDEPKFCSFCGAKMEKNEVNRMTNKEAIMILESVQPSCEKYSYSESEIYEAIDMAISALAERPKGEWIDCNWSIRCSECDYSMPWAVRNFCPSCGADMREVKE